MVCEIPLTRGKVALVDDEDYNKLSKYKWYANKGGNTFYAMRNSPRNPGKRKTVRMHVDIMGTTPPSITDHINGNGLDNRRCNLRTVTPRQNSQNLHIRKSSKYPGVCWDKHSEKWQVHVRIKGIQRHIGRFENEEDAANAYYYALNHPDSIPELHIKTSNFPGVSWNSQNAKWQTHVCTKGNHHFLGYYFDEETAGIIYAMSKNAIKMGAF